MAALGKAGRYARGVPLGLIVARYFAYMLAATVGVFAALALAFETNLLVGVLLPANYAETHVDAVAGEVAGAETFDGAALPSAFWYARFDADGALVETDLRDDGIAFARELFDAGDEGEGEANAWPSATRRAGVRVDRADGTCVVLVYGIDPQFSSRALRDALPNPQSMLIPAFFIFVALAFAALAVRAARVIARKMRPLEEAAARIERRDLDFAVGSSNVREINRVLGAMERMRASLAASLEEQWRAEAAQREQIAALAHDLKTPLTVARANAELLAEDAPDAGARASAEAVRDAVIRSDAFIDAIIAASRGLGEGMRFAQVDVAAFARDAAHAACELVRARGLACAVAGAELVEEGAGEGGADAPEGDGEGAGALVAQWDVDALMRAVANLVGNACDHSPRGGEVRVTFALSSASRPRTLTVTVEDAGSGFTPEALARGAERFFRDDKARAGGDEHHWGLGLAVADAAARAHAGRLVLGNRTDADGAILGARATLELPISRV